MLLVAVLGPSRTHSDSLCTSGFTDDVMLSYHAAYRRTDGRARRCDVLARRLPQVEATQAAVGTPAC